jgi:hypothetical protein
MFFQKEERNVLAIQLQTTFPVYDVLRAEGLARVLRKQKP